MTTVSVTQIDPNDEITASGANTPHNEIAAVINGNLDDTNIASVSGTKITDATITAAKMATAAQPETRFSDSFFDHVASGCVWSADAAGSTRVASMTAGVAYIGGKRLVISAITSRTFTASKDTYIDLDTTGTPQYTEVANNAASPALTSGYLRIGIIVTGAGSIAAAGSVNQGEQDKVLPIASSIAYTTTDSLGNLICPRDPNHRLLGYRQVISSQTGVTTEVDATGLSVPIIVPAGRRVKITTNAAFDVSNTDSSIFASIKESTTYLNGRGGVAGGAGYRQIVVEWDGVPGAGSHTYKAAFQRGGGTGTVSLAANPAAANTPGPAFIKVELV